MTRTPHSIVIAVAVFRSLTRLMPAAYRHRHRDEAVRLMARLASDAHRDAGARGVMRVAGWASVDLIMQLPAAHVEGRARRQRDAPFDSLRSLRASPFDSLRSLRASGVRVNERLRTTLGAVAGDVSYGVRSLRRRPLSSTSAIATLAIGIGLNAAVFSVFDWVLLRPLPYPSPEELVRVFTAGTHPATAPEPVKYSEFPTFSRATTVRTSTAFSTATRIAGGQGLDPSHVVVARVAGDLFGTFGVSLDIGRGFDSQEAASGAPIVVLSHRLWRTRMSADRSVVGRSITVDGHPHTVIGVMPAGRGYPSQADLWRPITADEREDDDRENVMIARLASGASLDRASLEMKTLAGGASGASRTAWVEDVQRTEVRDVRAAVTALLASAALLLLMACANVAALVGARGADRAGEMAIRGALGASGARLRRQIATECALLVAAGGAAGLVLGRWALDLLLAMAPGDLPRLAEITLDGRIVATGAAATLIAGVVVGLAPSSRASRLDLRTALGGSGSVRASRRTGGSRLLVVAQTAIAVLLTIGAGLLGRSLQHLVTIDHGFAPERLLAVDLSLRGMEIGRVRQLFRELIDRAQAVPGIRAVAIALRLPTEISGLRVAVRVDGLPATDTAATLRPVSPRYFETAGIQLTAGRVFTDGDRETSPRVAIVNAAFVRAVLGGGPAVGTRLTTEIADGSAAIVGVVADVTPAGEADRAAVYVPLEQVFFAGGSLLVRTAGETRSVVPALTTSLRAAAPALALDRIHDVADALAAGRAVTRFNTQLASSFAGLALLLAAIGVYGLTAGEVAARWRELAVRIALGATRPEALWTVVRPAALALGVGMFFGMAAALGVGRWVATLLRGVEVADAPTLVLVPLLLAAIGIAAASLAAARVLRADPAATLRGGVAARQFKVTSSKFKTQGPQFLRNAQAVEDRKTKTERQRQKDKGISKDFRD